jgi:hypothetical protein
MAMVRRFANAVAAIRSSDRFSDGKPRSKSDAVGPDRVSMQTQVYNVVYAV